MIENEWNLSVPTPEDADESGLILIRGDGVYDPLWCNMVFPENTISVSVYIAKGLSFRWKHTDEWIRDRVSYRRKIEKICPYGDTLAALADDGSLWCYDALRGTNGGPWFPMSNLPDGICKRSETLGAYLSEIRKGG